MTKKEKIQEAYGECYEEMKSWIDEKGWFNKNAFYQREFTFLKYKKIDLLFNHKGDFMIPKSIQGIENNNGWVKIESEDDLPNDIDGLWEIVMNGKQRFIELLKDNKSRLYKDFVKDGITHYKIIEKSKPPLY